MSILVNRSGIFTFQHVGAITEANDFRSLFETVLSENTAD